MSTYSIHFGGYVEAFSSSFVLFYHSVIITRTKSPIQNQFKNMLPGPLACIIKCVFSIASYGILVWSVFHIKIPQSSGFDNRNSFSHSSRGWKSKIKTLAGSVSPKASLLGFQKTAFSLRPHMAFFLCTSASLVCLPLPGKTPVLLG